MAVAIRKDLQLSDGQEFTLSQMIAVVLHLLVFAVLSFVPSPTVQEVPVRVLSIKLGADGAAPTGALPQEPLAGGNADGGMTVPASVLEMPEVDMEKAASKSPELEAMMEAELDKLLAEEAKPAERPVAAKTKVAQTNKKSRVSQPFTQPSMVRQPSTPKQFVREDFVSGSRYGNRQNAQEERIKRYTQQLSIWFHQRVVYPETARTQGLQGRGIVLITINRQGEVLDIAMDKSTGHRMLDDAALQTAANVNPMPPVPMWYQPGQPRLQFKFPVSFGR